MKYKVMMNSNIVARVYDPMIENFLVQVGLAVANYKGRLVFGVPSRGEIKVDDYRKMPVPISVMGDSIKDCADEFGKKDWR
jgi:hypothetical protein